MTVPGAAFLLPLALFGLSLVMKPGRLPSSDLIYARLIEPEAPTAGLAGPGGAPAKAGLALKTPRRPRLVVRAEARRLAIRPLTSAPVRLTLLPLSTVATVTEGHGSAPTAGGVTAGSNHGGGSPDDQASLGVVNSRSLGNDSFGARAAYAPLPEIPDDLRNNVFETEAIAHFVVERDGTTEVSLTRPTTSPRLNEVLLETLRQWQFEPAEKNGAAIRSEFDLRIPIAVE